MPTFDLIPDAALKSPTSPDGATTGQFAGSNQWAYYTGSGASNREFDYTGSGRLTAQIDDDPFGASPSNEYAFADSNNGATSWIPLYVPIDSSNVPTDFDSLDGLDLEISFRLTPTDDRWLFDFAICKNDASGTLLTDVFEYEAENTGSLPNVDHTSGTTLNFTLTTDGNNATKSDLENCRIRMRYQWHRSMGSDDTDENFAVFAVRGVATYTATGSGPSSDTAIGDNLVTGAYLGDTAVTKIYLGDTQIL